MFDNDGQVFETVDGIELEEVCCEYTRPDYRDGVGTDVIRWTFADDSVITVAGDGWDYGYVDCYCWRGAGHSDECDGVAR